MAEPCWILTYPNGDDVTDVDVVPHFRTEGIAQEQVVTYPVSDLGAPQPRRLGRPCITVACSCCEYVFDEVGITHFTDLEEAAGILPHCCWTQQPDGSWRCETCTKGPCDVADDRVIVALVLAAAGRVRPVCRTGGCGWRGLAWPRRAYAEIERDQHRREHDPAWRAGVAALARDLGLAVIGPCLTCRSGGSACVGRCVAERLS